MARRRRRYPRRRSYRKKKTIPILPIMGVAAPVLLMPRLGGTKNALACIQSGEFDNAAAVAIQNVTGYSMFEKKWSWENLIYGWTPILAGVIGHKVANMLGINRNFQNLPSPLNKLRL